MHASDAAPKCKVQQQRWQPPEEGWCKANADGAMAKAMDFGSGGAVVRDHHGLFRAGSSRFFSDTVDPELSELLACRRALQLAKELGNKKVILESDSQVAV